MPEILVIANVPNESPIRVRPLMAWNQFTAIPPQGATIHLSKECDAVVTSSRGNPGDSVGVIFVKVSTLGYLDLLASKWSTA